MIDALGKHSGEEQRVIADVLAHLPLAVEGRRRTIDGIRLDQHLAHISNRFAGLIVDFEELLDITEFRQQVSHIVHHLWIADANFFGVMPADQFDKQLLQRMRF